MPRRSRNFTEELLHICRDLSEKRFNIMRVATIEQYRKALSDRINLLTHLYNAELNIAGDKAVTETLLPLDKEDAMYRTIYKEMFSIKRAFIEGLMIGISGLISGYISDVLIRISLYSYYKLKYKSAWIWRGYLVSAYYDKLYTTICSRYEDVLEALYYACEYSNRFVKLIEGYEGHIKSMAHEYCSWMRRLRCHLSQVSFKLTPLTMIVAQDKHGNIYVATHIHSRVLTYSPYSRRIYGLPPHYEIILRRKPDISFSSRIDAGVIIAKFDANVVSARDFADRPYMVRKLSELLFRPYVISRDKARSLGMPEQSHNIDLCSVYFIPRPTKSKKLRNTTNATIRILSKPKIYFRQPKI